jgi:indole-3-glycerol phosphate synthase
MSDKLQEICDLKREHVARQKKLCTFEEIEKRAKSAPAVRPFAAALDQKVQQSEAGLICEIKKASPSAGLIRPDFDPAALAKAYETGGAACLSVLTDGPYFQGHDDYVIQARKACLLPVLRKDFIIDVWQIAESRAIGADCVLLIMAALTDTLAQELHDAATSFGMDILIETHDEKELERGLRLPSGLIGINNRNLKTLTIDLATTERLAPLVPKNRPVVCESGIQTAKDIERMNTAGVRRFLIGESLMRLADITTATRTLLSGN